MNPVKTSYLQEFDFDIWANERIIVFIEENKIVDERILMILGHILSAQILWMKRIREVAIPDYPLWSNYSTAEIREMLSASAANWKQFISTHPDEDFAELISYTNTEGLSFDTPLHEIISHVLYHGVYHRGQLAILIRDLGFTPPYTDYIAFVRKQ